MMPEKSAGAGNGVVPTSRGRLQLNADRAVLLRAAGALLLLFLALLRSGQSRSDWLDSHAFSCFSASSFPMPYEFWILPTSWSRLPATRSRSSSVSLPHCSFTLPFTCFQLPATRSQFMCVSFGG